MRRALCVLALPAGAMALAASCRAPLPSPPKGPPPPADAWSPVPYPPPPGGVEIVPPRPADDAVWVDGQWTAYERGRWVWERGGWVRPPAGAAFTPWYAVRRDDGVLVFAPPAWRSPRGEIVPAPPYLARAARGDPAGLGRPEDAQDEALDLPRPPGDASAAGPLLEDAAVAPPSLVPSAALPPPPDAGPPPAPAEAPDPGYPNPTTPNVRPDAEAR